MDKNYAIIDIETTGGSAQREKITEIAIAIYNGEKIIREYESLVNPERSIPPFITKLTGISNEMVKDAPKFYEIAKDVVEITEGCIFVAHNVRFDYGFIQEEFRRLGFNYSRKKLCTVRLSRKAFPGLKSYSLGNLIKHFNIEVNARHRAMADVSATVNLFKRIAKKDKTSSGASLLKDSMKNILLPENIDISLINELPEKTGIYYFLDKEEKIIYVGKSINIKKRIKQHFQNINPKSNKLYQRAVDIKYELTGSEMISFLMESIEIKSHQPEINKAARHKNFKYFIHHFINMDGYHVFEYEKNNLTKRKNKQILSEHVNLMAVKSACERIQRDFDLCQNLVGQIHNEGACFYYGIDRCEGACLGVEAPNSYNERAAQAAAKMDKISPENLVLIDKGRELDEKSISLVIDGNFHGYAFFDNDFSINDPTELIDYIPKMPYYPDQNMIIKRFLYASNGIEVIEF